MSRHPFDNSKWDLLARKIDNIIITMPGRFNPFRSTGKMYDVSEAYAILRNAEIVPKKYELREEIITPQAVFSKTGREALLKAVHSISTDHRGTKIALYSCGIYIFVVGCQSKQLFIVDTHPISEQLGGNGHGIIKVYPPKMLTRQINFVLGFGKDWSLAGCQKVPSSPF